MHLNGWKRCSGKGICYLLKRETKKELTPCLSSTVYVRHQGRHGNNHPHYIDEGIRKGRIVVRIHNQKNAAEQVEEQKHQRFGVKLLITIQSVRSNDHDGARPADDVNEEFHSLKRR